MTGIRNHATERVDRILDLLDNPTQRSTERGYGRQDADAGRISLDVARWAAVIAEEREEMSVRVLCPDEEAYAAALDRVAEIVATGPDRIAALRAMADSLAFGATDPWVAHQAAHLVQQTIWGTGEWVQLLVQVAPAPNRDAIVANVEGANISPAVVARAIGCRLYDEPDRLARILDDMDLVEPATPDPGAAP